MFFETGRHHETATCRICKKEKPCVEVRCKAGTLNGTLCAKCFFGQSEARTLSAKEDPKLPFAESA